MKRNLKKGIAMIMASFMLCGTFTGVAPAFNETQVYASTHSALEDLIIAEFPEGYSLFGSSAFSEGLVFAENNSEHKYAFIDKSGNIALEVDFDDQVYISSVESIMFVDGLAPFYQDGKAGFINKQGEVVVPLSYGAVSNFSEGLAAVEKDGKWGYIDATGTEVIPCIYDRAEDFSEDLAVVATIDEDWNWSYNYIDKSGNIAISGEGFDRLDSFSEGLAAVHIGGVLDFIDKTGTTKFSIDNIGFIYNGFSENRAFLLSDSEQDVHITDNEGNLIKVVENYGSDGMYASEYVYSEGLLVYYCEDNGEYSTGYLNLNGDIVALDAGYGRVRRFSEGVAIFRDSYIIKNPLTDGATPEVTPEVTPAVTPEPTQEETATMTYGDISVSQINTNILIDETYQASLQIYDIDRKSYLKLRDIAEVLKDTDKQCEVSWNNDKNAIEVTTNKAYTSVGGELASTGVAPKSVKATTSSMYVDGKAVDLQAYNIDENNYFELSDLNNLFDVNIGIEVLN